MATVGVKGLKVIGTSKQFKNKLKIYLQSADISNQ